MHVADDVNEWNTSVTFSGAVDETLLTLGCVLGVIEIGVFAAS